MCSRTSVLGQEIQLIAPTLDTPIPDDTNLLNALGIPSGKIRFLPPAVSIPAIPRAELERIFRRWGMKYALAAPGTQWLGLAVDIGTTKIAAYLVELANSKTLASKGVMNPQISYGEDVIARIVAASKSPAKSAKLQGLLVDALNRLAADLCTETGMNIQKP